MPTELRREIGSCVYRVAQESLSNIAKHAGAKRVSVILEGDREIPPPAREGLGYWLQDGIAGKQTLVSACLGMEERVGLLRGNFTGLVPAGERYGDHRGNSAGGLMVKRPRVLLADDHALILAGIRGLLEAHYDVVEQVGDGRSLVEAALRLRPDLIILDISLPVIERDRRRPANQEGMAGGEAPVPEHACEPRIPAGGDRRGRLGIRPEDFREGRPANRDAEGPQRANVRQSIIRWGAYRESVDCP